MSSMTIRQFQEKTGMSQATLRRKLIAIGVSPVGVSTQGKTSHLWLTEHLEKAFSLIGIYSAPRGRPKKV
jgi:DNA transposition AAA+ family ATPase